MANTTSRTKAKPKTSKKSSASRSRNAATTKKTTTTKAKAAVSTKKVATSRGAGSLPTRLHWLTVVSSVVLIVLTVLMMSPTKFPLSLSYLTKDSLLSQESTVFVPAERVQYDLELRWLLIGLLAFSALYSLLLLTRWKASYTKAVKQRVFFWRWAYLALSSAALVVIAALVTGTYDIMALKLLAGFTVLGYSLAWLSERHNEKSGRKLTSVYILGLLGMLLPWLVIALSEVATIVFGMVRLPWYAYATKVVAMLGSLAVFIVLWRSNSRTRGLADYSAAERTYVSLNLLTVAAVASILIAGLIK